MKFLYVYPEKCTGCRQCSLACGLKKFGVSNPKFGAINVVRDEFERYEFQFVCQQCEDPECVTACSKNALTKEENGIVKWHEDKCIGCRMCIAACPCGGISSLKGKIIKCDLCDGDPTCVKFCSTKAVVYEEETQEAINRRKQMAQVLRHNKSE